MRYPPGHKAEARQQILENVGALAKKQGFEATGVSELMAAAGLTSGALYTHFGSKSGMLEALMEAELQRSSRWFSECEDASALLDAYLSLAHVEHPEKGCILPALTAEVAHADPSVREHYEAMLLDMKAQLGNRLDSEADAWAILAQLVGAVMLARAMASSATRTALLDAVKRSIKAEKAE